MFKNILISIPYTKYLNLETNNLIIIQQHYSPTLIKLIYFFIYFIIYIVFYIIFPLQNGFEDHAPYGNCNASSSSASFPTICSS